jgi:hypothetical protein
MGSLPLNDIVLVYWLKLLICILYASLYTYFYSKVSDFAVIIGYLKKKCFYLFVAICIPFILFTKHSGCISFMYMLNMGAHGGVVVKALRYKPAGHGFDSRWCH